MKLEQRWWTEESSWNAVPSEKFQNQAQLVFIFGDSRILSQKWAYSEIRNTYPKAYLAGCSTAGEICDTHVQTNSLTTTAVIFDSTTIQSTHAKIESSEQSHQVGAHLAQSLEKEGLVHVLVFSDGLKVNGSELVNGLTAHLPPGIGATGGLAGDGDRFKETLVYSNGKPEPDIVTALGFYGSRLQVGFGSMDGFVPFGPERQVTRAKGNVLYELDGQSALELYKKYLGKEKVQDLATNQFHFPLSYRRKDQKNGVVRTILAINEQDESMIFAGDISEGGYARLMRSTPDRLIDGANIAATTCTQFKGSRQPDLALLISCVGRKIVLKQRVEEEIESIREIFDQKTVLTGFYSYGEIAHFTPYEPCNLHNQTMTITTFREK